MTTDDFFDELQAAVMSDPPEDETYPFRFGWRNRQVENVRELVIRWFDQQSVLELPL
jgi:hypothetical protein